MARTKYTDISSTYNNDIIINNLDITSKDFEKLNIDFNLTIQYFYNYLKI